MEVLEDLGFTRSEVKVYLALLSLGVSKAGPIVQETGLHNSVVHATLQKLVHRGVITFVRRGTMRHYRATDPSNLLRWIDGKRAAVEQALPELAARQRRIDPDEAEVFEGFRGFKAMCYKFIENSTPGDIYRFFAFITADEELDAEVYGFYREFTKDRQRRGIVIRGIADHKRKKLFRDLGYELGTIRFVKFPTVQNVSIFRNRIIMTPWEDRRVAFLLQSDQLASNFRRYFDALWTKHSTVR